MKATDTYYSFPPSPHCIYSFYTTFAPRSMKAGSVSKTSAGPILDHDLIVQDLVVTLTSYQRNYELPATQFVQRASREEDPEPPLPAILESYRAVVPPTQHVRAASEHCQIMTTQATCKSLHGQTYSSYNGTFCYIGRVVRTLRPPDDSILVPVPTNSSTRQSMPRVK